MSVLCQKVPSSMSFYRERDSHVPVFPKTARIIHHLSKEESLLDLTASTTSTAEDYKDDSSSSQSQEGAYMVREVKLKSRPPLSSLFQTSGNANDNSTLSVSSSRIAQMRAKLAVQRQSYETNKSKKRDEISRPPSLPFTPLGLECLIKSLRSGEKDKVEASMLHLHSKIHEQRALCETKDGKGNKTLEVTFLRKGGHLGILEALRNYPNAGSIQAMGMNLLTWLCEGCNVKRELVSRGTLRRIQTALVEFNSSPWVQGQSLCLLSQLVSLRKVAESIARGSFLQDTILLIHQGTCVDATLALLQAFCNHQSNRVTEGCIRQGTVGWVVLHMQPALEQLTSYNIADQKVASCERVLMTGCAILQQFATTSASTDKMDEARVVVSGVLNAQGLSKTVFMAAQNCQTALQRMNAGKRYQSRRLWIW
uniref:Uncharacterized protein n=1 Tax=Amphora coffeiformis TaxID=265554 RepID=A0A7S3P889_9STRA|mmetsp:Transcript_4726/g.9052  ORF Transcript_4726/g.9052 Transcript_4726/m.9052 type:complete len:424 (+) Transcript_4726:128-1399(+)|eukprot:scaffold5479_cov199-Amphora_coffeaeformis.AAC.18